MDARVKTVREILHSGDQYLIPFIQRFYSWDQMHWKRLLDDLTSLVDSSTEGMHFLGPLVCTPAQHVPREVTAYQLIDGQQRLTTLTLVLISLRDLCREDNLTDLAEEIHEDFLVHKRRSDLQHYKIVPRVGDREALVAILHGKELPPPILYLRFAGPLAVAAQDSRPSGSLLLSCKALSSSTSCRFIPAH